MKYTCALIYERHGGCDGGCGAFMCKLRNAPLLRHQPDHSNIIGARLKPQYRTLHGNTALSTVHLRDLLFDHVCPQPRSTSFTTQITAPCCYICPTCHGTKRSAPHFKTVSAPNRN